jgi:hypothetical protein
MSFEVNARLMFNFKVASTAIGRAGSGWPSVELGSGPPLLGAFLLARPYKGSRKTVQKSLSRRTSIVSPEWFH